MEFLIRFFCCPKQVPDELVVPLRDYSKIPK